MATGTRSVLFVLFVVAFGTKVGVLPLQGALPAGYGAARESQILDDARRNALRPRMIAVDTSALSSYFKGERNRETDLVDAALGGGDVALPPVVVTEMLSDPQAKQETNIPNGG